MYLVTSCDSESVLVISCPWNRLIKLNGTILSRDTFWCPERTNISTSVINDSGVGSLPQSPLHPILTHSPVPSPLLPPHLPPCPQQAESGPSLPLVVRTPGRNGEGGVPTRSKQRASQRMLLPSRFQLMGSQQRSDQSTILEQRYFSMKQYTTTKSQPKSKAISFCMKFPKYMTVAKLSRCSTKSK